MPWIYFKFNYWILSEFTHAYITCLNPSHCLGGKAIFDLKSIKMVKQCDGHTLL